MIELRLPWPPSVLNPNRRDHWVKKLAAKKKYRDDCFLIAKTVRPIFAKPKIPVTITFCPPNRIRRDDDNLVSMFKSGRDGIAKAWGIDDTRFVMTIEIAEPVKHGAVLFKVTK